MSTGTKVATASAVVAVIAGVVAIIADVGSWFKPDVPPAELHILAARVVDGENEAGQSIDVQLRNSGGEVAFITEVEFRITEHTVFLFSGGVPASEAYDVRFPTGMDLEGQTVRAPLSQRVDAGDVDRIILNVGTAAGGAAALHDYEAVMTLRYNEGKEVQAASPISLRLSFSR